LSISNRLHSASRDNQLLLADEGQEFLRYLGEPRFVPQKSSGQPMNALGFLRHVAFGVDIALKDRTRRHVVQQLHGGQLDDAMPGLRIQAGRFGIEDDLTQNRSPACPC
jgi:hypothetical protein